ncbi:MAG: phytoene/squalene synthase family protein [Candidatus Nanosalina sp.]
MDEELKQIFSENSTSYYYSSLVFPSEVREDVFRFYAYVRTADDFVDDEPQEPEELRDFRRKTLDNWESGNPEDKIVESFLKVAREKNFERKWVKAFLDSMEMDLEKSRYETMNETLEYIYGSAEVIGLMMTRILELDEGAEDAAKMLGRAMQYCNFLRDVEEDYKLGRRYLPKEEMEKFNLETLEPGEVDEKKFNVFMEEQVKKYFKWQKNAENGFSYIPYRERVPVILSSRLYKWTANQIYADPSAVYRKKIRPSRKRIGIELAKSLAGIR